MTMNKEGFFSFHLILKN